MTTTTRSGPTRAGVPRTRPAGRPPHRYELDLLRLVTFACVIAVHTLTFTVSSSDVAGGALLTVLHCTREVFFALTAFVLVHSARHRVGTPPRAATRRRFLLVGIPYLAWSAVYVVAPWFADGSARSSTAALVLRYLEDVVMGTAEYHLYFLLVTMQVYLVLPLLVRVLRRWPDAHLRLLAAALVVQLGITGVMQYAPGSIAWMHGAPQQLFPSYLFSIVAGGVAAARGDALLRWVREHRPAVVALVLAGAALALGTYAVQVAAGWSVTRASIAMQPVEVLWSAAAGLGLLALGAVWADHRVPGTWTSRAVAYASDRSFGIFLCHPLLLWLLLLGGGFRAAVPEPWRTPLAYALVVAGAVLLTEVLRRSSMSVALTGRPSIRGTRQTGGRVPRPDPPTPTPQENCAHRQRLRRPLGDGTPRPHHHRAP